MASGMSIEPEESAKSFVDVWGSVLEKLELFAKIIDRVSKVRLFDQMLPHLFIKAVRIDPSLCADCMLHTVSRTQGASVVFLLATCMLNSVEQTGYYRSATTRRFRVSTHGDHQRRALVSVGN